MLRAECPINFEDKVERAAGLSPAGPSCGTAQAREIRTGFPNLSSGYAKRNGVHGNIVGRSQRAMTFSLRKEVIQPQVLLRLPCYDFTPIMNYTLGGYSLAVRTPTSSTVHFRDVTGGVYKARERIHRGVLIRDY